MGDPETHLFPRGGTLYIELDAEQTILFNFRPTGWYYFCVGYILD